MAVVGRRTFRRFCLVTCGLWVGDCVAAVGAPFLSHFMRSQFEVASTSRGDLLVYALASAAVTMVMLWCMGPARAAWQFFSLGDVSRAVKAVTLGVTIGVVCAFAHDRLLGVARSVPFTHIFVQVALFVGTRLACQRLLARPGSARSGKGKQVLIVGCNRMALTYMKAIRELSHGSIEIAGLLAESDSMVGQTIHGKRVLGTIEDIGDVISSLQVHGVDVWKLAVATGDTSSANARAIASAKERFALSEFDIDTVLAAFSVPDGESRVSDGREMTARKPIYSVAKRTIDLVGSASLLIAVAPLMLVLCVVVAMDVGLPIVFWQQRLGKDGKRLTVYKFRTMRSPLDGEGRRLPDSRRVSAVGRWMRKLRLDELPQLLSILKGDMSFVGPRPLLVIDQPFDARRRLSIKPGLTGWAQVHGGNLVTIDDKNALDLWYVAHSSLRLDIEIAMRTIRMLLKGDAVDPQRIEQAKLWMGTLGYAGA